MKFAYLFAAMIAFAAVPGSVSARDRADDDRDRVTDRESARDRDEEIDSGRQVVIIETDDDRDADDRDRARDERRGERERHSGKGITVGALGGVEGYTGALAPRVQPGGAWGVNLGLQPSHFVGVELGYTGAANQIGDAGTFGGDSTIVRNGGHAHLKVSLAPRAIEPYVFSGVGISRLDVQGSPGFVTEDTFGHVPVGGGLNFHIGDFTAGARVSYNMLFDQDFVPDDLTYGSPANVNNANIWNTTLQLGATFF